jgi:hypothetical protein
MFAAPAPLALAVIGALGAETVWWTAVPPLVIGLSLLVLIGAVWRNPTVIPAARADPALALLSGTGAEPQWVLLGLAVIAPLLAYGLARVGLRLSRGAENPLRARLRGFARWLLISVPLVTIGVGDRRRPRCGPQVDRPLHRRLAYRPTCLSVDLFSVKDWTARLCRRDAQAWGVGLMSNWRLTLAPWRSTCSLPRGSVSPRSQLRHYFFLHLLLLLHL